MKVKTPDGATLLSDEDLRGLIPNLRTQEELNEFEEANIASAVLWAQKSRKLKKDLLSVSGLKTLHEKMFDETWEWAGKFRLRETNIGVDPHQIQNELGFLIGNVQYWREKETFSLESIAIRFHHKLVWIHPFPNGNGRFARLATDLFLEHQGHSRFTWGRQSLTKASELREAYLKALKVADREDRYEPLLKFAKS